VAFYCRYELFVQHLESVSTYRRKKALFVRKMSVWSGMTDPSLLGGLTQRQSRHALFGQECNSGSGQRIF
jgi:hypothetical protein